LKRGWIVAVGAVGAVWVLGGMGGCDPRDRADWTVDDPVAFDTAHVIIESPERGELVRVRVEVASTRHQQGYGLMERESLPAEHGMLFTYPSARPAESGFWMYRTLIPLDIAFLDDAGEIVSILQMDPCEAANPRLCPLYSPGIPYHAALEVNRGFFGRFGVQVGDRVRVQEDGSLP
jgi:uncharacterized protein